MAAFVRDTKSLQGQLLSLLKHLLPFAGHVGISNELIFPPRSVGARALAGQRRKKPVFFLFLS